MMWTLRGTTTLLTLASLAAATPLAGQRSPAAEPDPAPDSTAPAGNDASMACWRGRPLPECGGFFLVEAQGSLTLWTDTRPLPLSGVGAPERNSFGSQLDWNLGYMVNVDPKWAVGGVVSLGTGTSEVLSGLRARARRWIRRDVSVEAEAGALRTDLDGQWGSPALWGATADVRLNVGDHGSFFVRWDGVDVPERRRWDGASEPGGFEQALYAGVGTGSTWTVVGTGIGAALLLVLLSTVDWS